MAQITLYLDPDTAAKMKSAARAAGISQSRWVAELVRQKTLGEWPQSVMRLAGAWTDAPTSDRLRKSRGRDVRRERF